MPLCFHLLVGHIVGMSYPRHLQLKSFQGSLATKINFSRTLRITCPTFVPLLVNCVTVIFKENRQLLLPVLYCTIIVALLRVLVYLWVSNFSSQSVADGNRWSLFSDSFFPSFLTLDHFPGPLATHWWLISNSAISELNSSSDIYYSGASEFRWMGHWALTLTGWHSLFPSLWTMGLQGSFYKGYT